MRPRNVWLSAFGVALAVTAAACGGGSESEAPAASTPAAAPAAAGQRIDAATAGSVTGTVMIEGAAVKNEPIRMNADPVLDPMDLFAHVYAEPTPQLREQQAQLRAELDAEGDMR